MRPGCYGTRTSGSAARPLGLVLSLLFFVAGPALAQDPGTVRGTVTAEGRPLSGATVIVEGTNLGTLTGPAGTYEIARVPAGSHTVVARSLGYRAETQTVSVPAGGTATADFTLQIDPLGMEEIIVTGTATEVQKLQSSFAVTTVNAPEIERKDPLSTADLLQAIPGFHVEASGGVGGNNVFARGLPQDGSFRFVALHEDGLPVFESPELPFLNVDELHRLDETIRTMEGVRGGTGSIFASNAPGGVINFVSRTGGAELEGLAKVTVGDYGLFRADFNYGGPLADSDDWRFNVGGFYRFDNGVRDPGFPANEGGQFSANVTRLLENGYVRFRAKVIDDRNTFYLPIPLQNPEDPTEIPGFDPNFGTMTSIDMARVQVPTPQGETLEHNLRDGVHTTLQQVGAEASFDLGDGWTLRDNFRFTAGEVDFNAIFSVFAPAGATAFAQQRMADLGGTGFEYSFTNDPTASLNPETLNGNGLVTESGWWRVQVPFQQFVNDIRFSKDFVEADNTLTGGFYFASYKTDEFWNFNNILHEVRDQPRLIDLTVTGTEDGAVNVTNNGFTRYGAFYRNAANNAFQFSGYLQDNWRATDRVTIDVGLRFEHHSMNGNTEVLEDFDLGDESTLADDQVTWGSGQFVPYDEAYDELAVSGGVNFDIEPDRLAVFGRGTSGYRIPDFDQFNGQTSGDPIEAPEVQDVTMIEGGLKFSSPRVGAFVTAFYSKLTDQPFVDEVVQNGDIVSLGALSDAETIGAEIEVIAEPTPELTLDLNATLQRPELSNVRFTQSPPAGVDPAVFDGNQVRRIPEWFFQFNPSYRVPIQGPQSLEIFGTWYAVGERFEDFANRGALPAYSRFSVGTRIGITDRVGLQANLQNLSNTIGLTEGNPRGGEVVGDLPDLFLARPILGRSFRASLSYAF